MGPFSVVVLSYMLGSIPTGVLLARRLAGIDVQTQGSKNIGATNVARLAGKKAGILTLVLDMAKGALAVWIMTALIDPEVEGSQWWIAAAGLAAFLGHLFPAYLRFRGGKGVATACGVFLVLAPKALLAGLCFFLGGVILSQRVSVGSLSASAALPVMVCWFYGAGPVCVLSAVVSLLIIAKHHANIRRLMRGEEPKLGQSSTKASR